MNDAASWALVVATIPLVFIGAWYAWETHQVVERMDRERIARDRPLLGFEVVPWVARHAKVRIRNLGPGAAFSISGEVLGHAGGRPVASFPWSYPVLAPGQYEEFGFPIDDDENESARFDLDYARGKFEKLTAEFVYRSGGGDQYELNDAIDIVGLSEDWFDSRMLATEDHPDRLGPRMARALDEIADAIGQIAANLKRH